MPAALPGSHTARLTAFALALLLGGLGLTIESSWRRDHAPRWITDDPQRITGASEDREGVPPSRPPASDPQALVPAADPVAPPAQKAASDATSTRLASDTSPFLASEASLLAQLRSAPIVRIKKGSGGRTLAFKLTFADGSQGYFKPEQQVSSAHWYAEVAAHYLDRALGLGRVPPVVSRRIPYSHLAAAAADDPRIPELAIDKQGQLRGAVIRWLPERLVPAITPPGFENWLRMETFARWSVSPYQRASVFGADLAQLRERARRGEPAPARYQQIPTPPDAALPAALSDMILFDFLTLNYDRWGGDNTNVLTLGAGGPLIFLDNGDGFSVGPARRSLLDARLRPLQRFRKRTVQALRALDVTALGRRMAADPLGPILDEQALSHLEARRNAVLEHVAAQARRFGDAVYAW